MTAAEAIHDLRQCERLGDWQVEEIVGLIARQERMIEIMLDKLHLSNLCCDDDRPCPEDYIQIGCKGCWRKWMEVQG